MTRADGRRWAWAALCLSLGIATGCSPGGTGQVLSSSPNWVSAFTLDAANVYWADPGSSSAGNLDGSIRSVPIAGGAATVLATGQAWPTAIAVDSSFVYWVNSGSTSGSWSVMKVPIAGGAATTLASGTATATSVVLVSGVLFWVTASDEQGQLLPGTDLQQTAFASTSLLSMPVGGGTPVTVATGVTTSLPYPDDGGDFARAGTLLADASRVYWPDGNSQVLAVSAAGGSPTALATGQVHPVGLALDSQNLYWVNHGSGWPSGGADGAVMKVPLAGGAAISLASGQNAPVAVAVDGTSIYWTTSTVDASHMGTVVQMPLAGGASVTLGSSNAPTGALTDTASVYWLDNDLGSSTIRRVAK
jgi:hypothetical protein